MKSVESVRASLDPARTRRRLERNTVWASIVFALMAAVFVSPRFGISVGLGGTLGVLNLRWISTSLRAILDSTIAEGRKPPASSWRFVLRYFVIGAVILLALQTGWFSLPGILLGLCAFVGAAFVEAVYSLILTYRHASL